MHNKRQRAVNRIVLLGASNLTLSLRIIVHLLQQSVGSPSEVLVAAGHGRSYGHNSRMLLRELPGIVHSGLWQQLHSDQLYSGNSLPVYALLTDIGNDIPYGCLPEQIVEWIAWCVEQLQQINAHIVVTNLPIASIELLSEVRFSVLRRLIFPSCRLARHDVIERAHAVYQHLCELAVQRQVTLLKPDDRHIGIDGIHVSLWKRRDYYQQLFKDLKGLWELDSEYTRIPSLSWRRHPQFAERRVFGRIRQADQPSGLLSDCSSVSLY